MDIRDFFRLRKFPFLARQILDVTTKSIGVTMTFLWNIWKAEEGQDLIEYTLLMAFIALASASLFLAAGKSIKGIWTSSNSQLSAAKSNLGGS
jgi:Flp pilus assembly pilin Flp